LTLLNPTEGQYYAANNVAQTSTTRAGWYQGVRFGLQRRLATAGASAPTTRYSKCTNEASRGARHQQRYPGADHRHHQQPSAPGHVDEQGPVRADRRHNFNLSAVLVSPGFGPACSDADEGLADGIIWQARSGSPITPTPTGDTR
jgi:hypothetical protein